MKLMLIDDKYVVIDNGIVVLSADSKEELYSKAVKILQAFEHPVDTEVPSVAENQLAIDLLSGNI
jgi:hypothetical protein